VTVEKKKNKENGNKKQEVIVSIKDTGMGIDPEIFPRLFTKFATKSETGTGLGLFICKSIIEVHGGRIWTENNNTNNEGTKQGGGAVFVFTLPISEQHHHHHHHQQQQQ
jgi:signal transduction histidine kinase